jgi:hypothetical protein
VRQGAGGQAHRFLNVAERIFGHQPVFAFAQQQADGRLVTLTAQLLVHGLDVEVKFARKLGLKIHCFQLHHHIAMQASVLSEQV